VIIFFITLLSMLTYFYYSSMIQYTKKYERDKSTLILNSIEPIVAINLFLGFDQQLKEYLDNIIQQNPMISKLIVTDTHQKVHYSYIIKSRKKLMQSLSIKRIIYNKVSPEPIGKIEMRYSNEQYTKMVHQYRIFSIFIIIGAVILIALLITILRSTLRPLRELAQDLFQYDPKKLNFEKRVEVKDDEIGTIQTAVISMVIRINDYTQKLRQLNRELEKRVRERTKKLQVINKQLRKEIKERKKIEKALRQANQRLERLSTHDALTNLFNRRVLEEKLLVFWKMALRDKKPISILMCDIDFFKKVNDTYGHQAGDQCLQEIAKILKSVIHRSSDIVARYGGEEFIFVLFNTPTSGAIKIAEKVQKSLEKRNKSPNTKIKMTLSIGIASIITTDQWSWEDIIQYADQALYQAKENGRNRIEIATLKV